MDLEEEFYEGFYEDGTEELPVVLEDPKVQVYLPVATTQTKGIASFDAKDFNVDPKGKVALNEDLHQIKENTDSALEKSQEGLSNSEEALSTANTALSAATEALSTANGIDGKATEALSTANEALGQVVEGLGSKIYVNGVLQSSVNVDSDIQEQFDQLTEEVEDIKELVPSQASAQNQLADKNFVNSSINAIAAFYITYDSQGNPFPTKAALVNATTFYSGGETRVPTRNDYCLVLADETHDNASCRYVYSGEYPNGQWDFQFVVNESPFTSDQLAAINSGITSALVQQIPNKADLNNPEQNITTKNLVAGGTITVNGKTVATLPDVEAVKPKCEQISNYSGYATGNHSLISGKYFSNYDVLIFVFQITGSGANEYVTLVYPRQVFTVANRKFSTPFNTKDTNRYMNFYYINNNTFKIDSSSYVEMREIWGIK